MLSETGIRKKKSLVVNHSGTRWRGLFIECSGCSIVRLFDSIVRFLDPIFRFFDLALLSETGIFWKAGCECLRLLSETGIFWKAECEDAFISYVSSDLLASARASAYFSSSASSTSKVVQERSEMCTAEWHSGAYTHSKVPETCSHDHLTVI